MELRQHDPLLSAPGHAGIRLSWRPQVTSIDPDTVSETNCVRQPFCLTEIGFPKAIVLAHPINLFWGLNWQGMQSESKEEASPADGDGAFPRNRHAACEG